MTDLPARLADVLAQHDAMLRPTAKGEEPDHRVLLPADEQRGPVPVRLGQLGSSVRSSST
jgi:hypothetical protein